MIATIINEEAKANLDKLTIVKYSKEAENDYIGVASGIMDQFAVAFGEKDRCIKLDTATLEYSLAKFELGDNDLVIRNSNKKRTLADSKCNLRVQEVNAGLDDLRKYIDFPYACAISLDDLYKYQDKIKNLQKQIDELKLKIYNQETKQTNLSNFIDGLKFSGRLHVNSSWYDADKSLTKLYKE